MYQTLKIATPIVLVLALTLIVSLSLYKRDRSNLTEWDRENSAWDADIEIPLNSIFSPSYPVDLRFEKELALMRYQKKLKAENEILIHQSIAQTSMHLEVPPALLWCLFFQESRLNHLLGIDRERGAHGLGQFGYFSFFEINRQIDKFYPRNREILKEVLGEDVRPVEARRSDLYHPSSYYFIPTAVVTSAIYLNNRYHHLASLLKNQKLKANRDILWLYAAIAYNKGTRSVLSLWNQIQRMSGREEMQKILQSPTTLSHYMDQSWFLKRTLRKIWNKRNAEKYAKEWRIHFRNIQDCATTEVAS